MTKFYKDGDRMGISTTCTKPNKFIEEVSKGLEQMIDSEEYTGDWTFQFNYWLPNIFSVYNQLLNLDIRSGDCSKDKVVHEVTE